MPNTTIEANRLTKLYGDHRAVDEVSFSVERGEIFAYLGRNGSGKTTTVRMLTTLTAPTSGSATVCGHDIAAEPMKVKSRIGVTMQDAALDPQMSGREHLEFVAAILGHRSPADRSDEMLELFGLTEAAANPSATYSGGMKRRLDIASALLGDPEVLFLDEPTTGLDPQSRRAMWGEIERLKARGVTIFLTTQYLEEAELLADHLAIIDRGAVIAKGTAATLKASHGRKRLSFRCAGSTPAVIDALRTDRTLEVDQSGGRITVDAPTTLGDHDLLRLADQIGSQYGDLRDLEITASSLEDVFLRLTGTSINETRSAAVPDMVEATR